MENHCYKCGMDHGNEMVDLFGYTICKTCKSKSGLFQDKTLKRYVNSFTKAKEADPDKPSFEEEITNDWLSWRKNISARESSFYMFRND